MKDNLKKKGRHPQKNEMEDDLKKKLPLEKMEDKLIKK